MSYYDAAFNIEDNPTLTEKQIRTKIDTVLAFYKSALAEAQQLSASQQDSSDAAAKNELSVGDTVLTGYLSYLEILQISIRGLLDDFELPSDVVSKKRKRDIAGNEEVDFEQVARNYTPSVQFWRAQIAEETHYGTLEVLHSLASSHTYAELSDHLARLKFLLWKKESGVEAEACYQSLKRSKAGTDELEEGWRAILDGDGRPTTEVS